MLILDADGGTEGSRTPNLDLRKNTKETPYNQPISHIIVCHYLVYFVYVVSHETHMEYLPWIVLQKYTN